MTNVGTTVEEISSSSDPQSGAQSLVNEVMRSLGIRSLRDALLKEPRKTKDDIRYAVYRWLHVKLRDADANEDDQEGIYQAQLAEQIACALDHLEVQLEAAQPDPEGAHARHLHLVVPPGPRPVPAGVTTQLAALDQIWKVLPDGNWSTATPTERVGLLTIMLITRSALCHKSLVEAFFQSLVEDEPVWSSPSLLWVTLDVEIDGFFQRRRIFLDPCTLAAAAVVREDFKNTADPVTGVRSFRIGDEISAGWSAVRRRLHGRCALPIQPSRLMEAVSTEIHLTTVPLVASYARGIVASSSFQESGWHRILGLAPRSFSACAESTRKRDGRGATNRSGVNILDAAISEPFDADDFLCRLRSSTRPGNRRENAIHLVQSLIDSLNPGETKWYVAGWIKYLLQDARHGANKRLEVSTVNFFRSILASRLIDTFPDRMDEVAGDEMTDLFQELADGVTTANLRTRVINLIHRFNAYCITRGKLRINGQYQLPARSGGDTDISSRHVSEVDYRRALEILKVQIVKGNDRSVVLQAQCFLILAYRFGARRSEILGLTLNDVHNARSDCYLEIRPNSSRVLKTRNAERTLPLSLLEEFEVKIIKTLWLQRDKEAQRSADRLTKSSFKWKVRKETYLFLPNDAGREEIDSHKVPGLALKALHCATGDHELHVHHLRHSFATRHVIGTLLSDLSQRKDPYIPTIFQEMAESASKFHKFVFARFGRSARRGTLVSMAIGHGSDETTYRHYVHGFDILVHAALNAERPRFRQRRRGEVDLGELSHAETRLISSVLGLSEQTRPTAGRVHAWVSRHAASRGINIQYLDPATSSVAPTLNFEWAIDQPELKNRLGFPRSDRQIKSARAVFLGMAKGISRSSDHAWHAISVITSSPGDHGWSRLSTSQVIDLQKSWESSFGTSLSLDFCQAKYIDRKRSWETLTGTALSMALRNKAASVYVRVTDPVSGPSPVRERGIAAVSWSLRAAMHWRHLQSSLG